MARATDVSKIYAQPDEYNAPLQSVLKRKAWSRPTRRDALSALALDAKLRKRDAVVGGQPLAIQGEQVIKASSSGMIWARFTALNAVDSVQWCLTEWRRCSCWELPPSEKLHVPTEGILSGVFDGGHPKRLGLRVEDSFGRSKCQELTIDGAE